MLLFRNNYCLLKEIHTFIGLTDFTKFCKNCFSTYSIDNEVKNHQKLCFGESAIYYEFSKKKVSKVSFRFSKFLYEIPLYFLGVAGFDAMNEDNTLKTKINKHL